MSKFKIALVVGSNRKESLNKKVAQALARLGEDRFAFRFVQIDDLPVYNQDLENPLPGSVARFKAEIADSDGVLFVTPEHNRSIPAVLKSAIDWGARPYGQSSWDGKPAAITGATPGAIGTAVAQQHLRAILGDLGMTVMGGEAYLSVKPGLVDENLVITDESTRAFLRKFLDRFADLVGRYSVVQEMAA